MDWHELLPYELNAGAKGAKGGAGKKSLFLLYMDAVSIVNQRSANDSNKAGEHISQPVDHLPAQQAVSFTLRDLHFIVKFAQVGTHKAFAKHNIKMGPASQLTCCSCQLAVHTDLYLSAILLSQPS